MTGFDPPRGPVIEVRQLRPEVPNDNDPADNPPATVGPPTARPGDPDGFEIIVGDDGPPRGRTMFTASPWSGWPAEWNTPLLGQFENLVDTAWMCLDLNSSIISTMPPYATMADGLVASPTWLTNPDPELYTSWDEFAKQLWWDFQMGEAFVICTARFADGYPARFHVLEPWLVDVEMGSDGRRQYRIGTLDPGDDLLHIRYKSTTSSARGVGPLDAGRSRMVAAGLLQRYASRVFESGGVPYYVIKHPLELTEKQITDLQMQWWTSRMNSLGMPAVLSGGIEVEQLQISPEDMALLDLSRYTDSRIAVLLGVPPFLVGLPAGGDSMTYSNVESLFEYHWRAGLKPKVSPVVHALSQWALPRGTDIEVNRDEYVRPGPYERAQTWQILVDLGVLTPQGVQQLERFAISGQQPARPLAPAGVLT
jgi:HK97 family phage portal protein